MLIITYRGVYYRSDTVLLLDRWSRRAAVWVLRQDRQADRRGAKRPSLSEQRDVQAPIFMGGQRRYNSVQLQPRAGSAEPSVGDLLRMDRQTETLAGTPHHLWDLRPYRGPASGMLNNPTSSPLPAPCTSPCLCPGRETGRKMKIKLP